MAKQNGIPRRITPELDKLLRDFQKMQKQRTGIEINMAQAERKFAEEVRKKFKKLERALLIIEK